MTASGLCVWGVQCAVCATRDMSHQGLMHVLGAQDGQLFVLWLPGMLTNRAALMCGSAHRLERAGRVLGARD